ncbi:MAG: acyl-CoA synthetase [Solirubrobacteraceae bacterium]
MTGGLADVVFAARVFTRAGIVRPSRPDRVVRAVTALRRYGPTLAAGYRGCAARYPERSAIIDEGGTLTFAEVDARTNALAHGLAARGLRAGDRVAIMCRNHRGFIEASIACSKLGAHAVYLNTAFARPQVTEVVEREAPAMIIYDDEFAGEVAEAVGTGRTGLMAWVDGGAGAAGTGANAATPPASAGPATASGGDETLQQLIDHSPTTPLPPPENPGRTVILTSGTTGTPKGANRASPDSLQPAAALLDRIPLRAREPTMIAAPLFHSWGFAHFFLSTALGSTLVLRRRFDPEDTLRAVAEQHATALIVVPVMLQRMLELPDEARGRYDVSELRVIASSGSALPGPLAQRVMDAFGDRLYNLYGSTEVAWAAIATPEDLRAAPGTAGRIPRGTVARVLDEHGRPLPDGQPGRIFVGSELLFEGYTGGEDKARIGSLMSTGDVGHFDAAGRLFVDGRDDDMIVSGGENVFPGEVEDRLARVAGVKEAAVIGVPDEEFGQRLRAFVVPQDGVTLSEADLKEHVRDNLARYKVPRDVVFVDVLPRNATGKVLKRELARD